MVSKSSWSPVFAAEVARMRPEHVTSLAALPVKPALSAVTTQKPVSILMVDDEPKNLLALRALLEGEDRTMVEARSGTEALRHLLHDDFAVILLDVHMPDLDGFETAALIRERQKTRDVPIIFLTAASRSETFVARGYSVGAVDYIIKPVEPDILRSKVNVFVELFKKTEQVKQQAAQLAETTEFLNSVLEGSTEYAITATDLDGTYLSWNSGARRLYGYTAEEVIGQQTFAILHTPEDLASGASKALYRTALRRGKAEAVLERVSKTGRRFFTSVAVAVRRDASGAPVGFVTISQDITARLQAEEERAQLRVEQAGRAEAEAARDRLRQILDVLPEGIIIADAHGQIMLYNATAQEILGQTPVVTGVAEHTIFGAQHFDGNSFAPEELPLSRAVLHGTETRGEQLLVRNAVTNQLVPVLVNSAPLRDASGAITGGVAVFQDITAIKDLETEKDAFLAAASHDLKNPLTGIKARAQILIRRLSRPDPPDIPSTIEGLRNIDHTSTRLTGMINELLDVTRLQMGRPIDLERQPMDLLALAHEVVTDFIPFAERHQIQVRCDSPDLHGVWDRGRLERVLTNLISNAIKFSPHGGAITLTLSRQEHDGTSWATVAVQDEGIGIPEHDLPRIFERFFRASNAIGKIEGTGIGLSGSRHIAEQHGGTLSVESSEGKGSTFTLRLPLNNVNCADLPDIRSHAA